MQHLHNGIVVSLSKCSSITGLFFGGFFFNSTLTNLRINLYNYHVIFNGVQE